MVSSYGLHSPELSRDIGCLHPAPAPHLAHDKCAEVTKKLACSVFLDFGSV